jgi:hypothetical protein
MNKTVIKKHSFRRYLFVLIASFIVVLVTVQLWFFSDIQNQIKTEIQQRSLALSNVAVKVASETMFVSREVIAESPTVLGSTPERGKAEKPNVIRLKIHDTPNKEVNLGGGYTFVTGNETKTVSIDFPDEQSLVSERQQVKKVIRMPAENMADITDGLEFSTVGDAFQLAVIEPENNVFSRHIIQFDEA